jgi:hypothetical protein
MFRIQCAARQSDLILDLGFLSAEGREALEAIWAGTFRRELLLRFDERPFAPLYSDVPSRPNVPVNALVGAETLKAGFGWTDAELMENVQFNFLVRHALGLGPIGGETFDVRTLYNFRSRVSEYRRATGIDLIEKAFEGVTDEQLAALGLKTGRQRMDSTMVSSNIRLMSRLHLLVDVVQGVHMMLSEPDRMRYREELKPYVQGTAGQFVFRVPSEEGREHIRKLGELMGRLVRELEGAYGDAPAYAILARVFEEQFLIEDAGIRARRGKDIPSGTVQSTADPEATYRKKAGREYVGYVANVTETCDPRNPVQLITKVQVDANTTDDPTLMAEALPALQERMPVRQLYTDGGYNSEATATLARESGVEHIQTALRGHTAKGMCLADFEIETSEGGQPTMVTCPHGERAPVRRSKQGRYIAHLGPCDGCPKERECCTEHLKSKGRRGLYFTLHDWEIARRRQRIARDPAHGRKMRGPIEPTMAALKRPFGGSKLPVRGRWRVKDMLTAAAAMLNVRRIHRAQATKMRPKEAIAMVATTVHWAADRFLCCVCHVASLFQAGYPQTHAFATAQR